MNLSANQDWRLVHRLDAATSGVMVVAAAGDPAASVAKAFAHGRVRKEYRALVSGVPSKGRGTVDDPLAQGSSKEGTVKAVTDYQVVARVGKIASWLRLLPKTGRRHQLRIHCSSSLQCPIIGDKVYSKASDSALLPSATQTRDRMHLHALAIQFPHPIIRGRIVTAHAPIPKSTDSALVELGLKERVQANDWMCYGQSKVKLS